MSNRNVLLSDNSVVEELTFKDQQQIQGGGKIKFAVKAITAVAAAGLAAAKAGVELFED